MAQVRSDDYKGYKEEMKEMYADMGIDATPPECIPVDLYGKRVNLDKNDPTNLEKTAENIKEFYGLDDY